ncbi:MAG: FHA domain-containing protein [Lachnospiraceae bacterium]|nr:FHA domain-containing protein [Lachnospiraceae bacterium]
MNTGNYNRNMTVTRSIAMNKKENGAIIGTRGFLLGKIIRISSDNDVIIGRDPAQCEIIVKGDKVSRAHLRLRYNSITEDYTLYDTSSNGTIIDEKYKLKHKTHVNVKSGSKIWLGDSDNEIMLG